MSLTAAVLIELRIRTDNFQESLGWGKLCFFMYAAVPGRKVRVENVYNPMMRKGGLKLMGRGLK